MVQRDLIQNIYLFRELPPACLDELCQIAGTESFGPGDTVFSQGDAAEALYIVKHGSVEIQQRTNDGDSLKVTTLASGSHFGEMAFLDSENRSASAAVVEPTEVVVIKYSDLQKFLERDPSRFGQFYKALSQFLCNRLRLTTRDLKNAREINLKHF